MCTEYCYLNGTQRFDEVKLSVFHKKYSVCLICDE